MIRTQESVILDASDQNPFSADEYIRQKRCRSVLCLPLLKQAKLIGVLYLENNLTSHVFTPARIAVLKLLASQAAISLENARLYSDLRHADAYLAEAQRLSHTGSFGWNVSSGEISGRRKRSGSSGSTARSSLHWSTSRNAFIRKTPNAFNISSNARPAMAGTTTASTDC